MPWVDAHMCCRTSASVGVEEPHVVEMTVATTGEVECNRLPRAAISPRACVLAVHGSMGRLLRGRVALRAAMSPRAARVISRSCRARVCERSVVRRLLSEPKPLFLNEEHSALLFERCSFAGRSIGGRSTECSISQERCTGAERSVSEGSSTEPSPPAPAPPVRPSASSPCESRMNVISMSSKCGPSAGRSMELGGT